MLPLLFSSLLNGAVAVTTTTDKSYFPEPPGSYYVGKTQHVFNLTNPESPVTVYNDTDAYIVVTILYPTEQEPAPETSSKYMDYELARLIEEGWDITTGELQKLWTPMQWQPPVIFDLPAELKLLPTLIFSPGAGMPCSSSTLATSDMASHGCTVLCIDHPGEAPYLQIPYTNGTAGVYGFPIYYDWALDKEVLREVYDRRKRGVGSLLQLYPALVESFGAPFNTSSYLHFGFSMGGSLGSDILARHDDVLAGVNYDGIFHDTYLGRPTADVRKPFLMLGSEQRREWADPTRGWFQGNQTGWCRDLRVLGSFHYDFSKVGLWFELLVVNDTAPLTGTIESLRMREVMNAFTMEFFDGVLGGDLDKSLLLNGPLPSREWPEVVLWNSSAITA